jgi:precorrin-6B methylase 1
LSARLRAFLAHVATDPDALSRFLRDPRVWSRKCGLTRAEIAIVLSGDVGCILGALTGKPARGETPVAPAKNPFADDLVVIGTGIRTVGQLTLEAIAWLKRAERVLYLVSDPVAEAVVRKFHGRSAESLQGFYAPGRERRESYEAMVEAVLRHVRRGRMTCFAAYGHPGVFAYPTHEAVRRARAEGYRARMLPGISAEDCLFADLGVDPATTGCQSYEATDFLLHGRSADPSSHLVLWQIGVLGNVTFQPGRYEPRGMPALLHRLFALYPAHHPVIVYEAPVFAGGPPTIHPLPLAFLGQAPLSTASTLYVPPARASLADVNAARQMGLVP